MLTDTLSNIGNGLMESFKKMGLKFLPGQYNDPTSKQQFQKWQAPKGAGECIILSHAETSLNIHYRGWLYMYVKTMSGRKSYDW